MASAAESPPTGITDLLRWRNLAVVPRDQQRLLEGEGSWAVELRDTPHGSGQVPGDVLRTVKEAYIRQRASLENRPQSSPLRNGVPNCIAGGDENAVDQDQELPQSPSEKAQAPSSLPSSPERQIPWSPSPSRAEGRSPSPAVASHVFSSPTRNPVSNASTPKLPTPKVSTAGISRLAPPPRVGTQLQAAPAFEFPSSCDDVEDMEAERNSTQHQHDVEATNISAPIPRSAAMTSSATTTDTPPCGQREEDTIPSTGQKPMEPTKSSPAPARRKPRRMKPIVFSPGPAEPGIVPATVVRMPGTKIFPGRDILDAAGHASSMIPATCGELNPRALASVSGNRALRDQAWQVAGVPRYHMGIEEDTSTSGHESPEPVARTIGPDRLGPAFNGGHDGLPKAPQSRIDKGPVDIQPPRSVPQANKDKDEAQAPYEAFITTYPDYVTDHSGSLWHFIAACVYLRRLQEHGLMREYLYDDFIRAFSGQYLAYVRNAGPGQEPLCADEWYNRILGPILFNHMSVRRDNLDQVLSSYPEEVARAMHRQKGGSAEMDKVDAEMRSAREKVPVSRPAVTEKLHGAPEREKAPVPALAEIQPPAILIHDTPPPEQSRAASLDLGSDSMQPEPQAEPEPIQQNPIHSPTPPAPQSTAPKPPRPPRSSWTIPSSGAPTSSARSDRVRKRSAEEQERLRQHFRKRRSMKSAPGGSSRASAA